MLSVNYVYIKFNHIKTKLYCKHNLKLPITQSRIEERHKIQNQNISLHIFSLNVDTTGTYKGVVRSKFIW